MKQVVLIPAAALALCAFCTAAVAMSTVPYRPQGQYLGPRTTPELNGSVRNPNDPDSVNNPRDYRSPYYFGPNTGRPPNGQNRPDPGFLNIDPFDPNSVVNSFDRQRYANPYPYDPLYNPYGQGRSPYAPDAPNVPMGQGIPYAR